MVDTGLAGQPEIAIDVTAQREVRILNLEAGRKRINDQKPPGPFFARRHRKDDDKALVLGHGGDIGKGAVGEIVAALDGEAFTAGRRRDQRHAGHRHGSINRGVTGVDDLYRRPGQFIVGEAGE